VGGPATDQIETLGVRRISMAFLLLPLVLYKALPRAWQAFGPGGDVVESEGSYRNDGVVVKASRQM